MKKAIIFDFDGTIADNFELVIDIAKKLIGHPAIENETDVSGLMRQSVEDVMRKLDVSRFELPLLIVRGRRQMAKRITEVRPIEGISEALKELHAKGYTMFIVSSNSTSNIRSFLKNNGLSDYFKAVYGNIGLLNKSSAISRVIGRNKLNSGGVIYIGDEVRDIVATKQINIPIIAVSWGFNDKARLIKEQPAFLINEPSQLLGVVEGWESGQVIATSINIE